MDRAINLSFDEVADEAETSSSRVQADTGNRPVSGRLIRVKVPVCKLRP